MEQRLYIYCCRNVSIRKNIHQAHSVVSASAKSLRFSTMDENSMSRADQFSSFQGADIILNLVNFNCAT